jgi:hypothetical protein
MLLGAAPLGSACGGPATDSSRPRPTSGGSGGSGAGGSGAGGMMPSGGMSSGEGGAGANPGGSSGEGGAPGEGGGPGEGGASGEGGTGGMRVFDAGNDPALNNVGPGSLCDRLSTIQCAGEAFCCTSPGRDFAACKQVMQKGCDDELMFDALAGDAKTGFDAEHARLAYTEIERRASLCDTGIAAFGESVDGLRGMFKGSVGPGSSCMTLNPTYREEAGKALASCLDPSNNACLPESLLRWTCTPHAEVGGDCFTDVNCNAGLFCDNPDLSISGSTCMTRKAIGAGCGLPNECDSLFCRQGQCVEATVDAAYCLSE